MKETLQKQIMSLGCQAKAEFLLQASEEALYQAKVLYLGKKGKLTDILKELGKIPSQDRPQIGVLANQVKAELESLYEERLSEIKQISINESLQKERVDISLPGIAFPTGTLHPITRMLNDMKSIFRKMGFDIFEGPEIETDYYNFEALNIPKDHPARDMQDTFYLEDGRLLRTHTSPVQIRVMEKFKPPIQMIAPGTVYRCDSDVSHTPMFHQIEALVVDRGISVAHLKGVIEVFLREIFAPHIPIRFRPSFFPFTEPSAEVDIECVICSGKGCRVCKNTGWLEVMGCGMVDPEVFKFVNIDPEIYSGFAFGIGIERTTMLKHGISDIRLFFENDPLFLNQFTTIL